MATRGRRDGAPSLRWKQIREPPASTTAMVSGFMPASLPLATTAAMMVLAWATVMVMGGVSVCILAIPIGQRTAGG